MSISTVTGLVLIGVPVAFNVAFFALGRAFDYPAILRREPDEVLRRFAAGGTGLLVRWHALLLSALAMLPVAVLLGIVLDAAGALTALSIATGVTAALVQALGLARWPYAVPELARRYLAADGSDPEAVATRRTVEVLFATLHRFLGVGVGEHLGYLLTGAWTLLVAGSMLVTDVLPAGLGVAGIPIGVAMLLGSLEFAGPYERDGWAFAGTIVPIAYIGWSLWLIAAGVLLLVGGRT